MEIFGTRHHYRRSDPRATLEPNRLPLGRISLSYTFLVG